MHKEELITSLEYVGNSCILGLAAVSLFKEQEIQKLLEESDLEIGDYTVDLKQVSQQLKADKRGRAISEYIKMLFRVLIKESFELVKSYCKDSNQTSLIKAETWYQFARIIRNCLSHDFRFVFNKHDKNILPVSWKCHTISIDMDGQYLDLKFLSWQAAIELIDDLRAFVKEGLA